jgi:hypothetical protein
MLFEGFTNIFIGHKKNKSKPQLVKKQRLCSSPKQDIGIEADAYATDISFRHLSP